ncbi:MAG TPA: ABC transporter ATP-binding protein [Methylomirabilota bacterium]|nr:ABC transporter ATP-binding protein [Methylomirabilota bacterium]
MTAPPVLALHDVGIRRSDTFALDVPALDVRPGEVLAVIGPNGSGKSTLLRVLGLLQSPDRGEVCYQGRAVTVAEGLSVRRRMAMVFQAPMLADTTVDANVALGLGFRGVPAAARAPRVRRWLERFGVGGLGPRPARLLSGGEAQRVALARALVLEPEVLLLDEPFSSLDEPTRAALAPELGAVLRAERVTTVLVTHDRAEAQALADRVAVLIDGRLHQVDETARTFQAPVSEAVARFVGVETIVSGEVIAADGGVVLVDVSGRRLEVGGTAHPGERVRLGIRPEDVTLARPTEGAALSSARNHLTGTVVRLTPGSPVRVLVDVGFSLVAAVTPRSVAELALAPGVPITAIFKASAAHLIRGC